MSLYLALFLAGVLTILLPCILPLVPIVLGVSVAGRNPWRPLLTVLGMVVSFVAFTFLLNAVLSQFYEAADLIRIGTYYLLFIFGTAFFVCDRNARHMLVVLGSFFFIPKGWIVWTIAACAGAAALELGTYLGNRIQQLGADVQLKARSEFGEGSPITAFLVGLTLGLVWVPCAGPALGFAFALIRESADARAGLALLAYASGTAVPLLLVGYGGQRAVHSVRAIAPYAGRIKQIAGVVLMLTAVALYFNGFSRLQVWFLEHTSLGDIGTRLEEEYFGETFESAQRELRTPDTSAVAEASKESSSFSPPSSSSSSMPLANLPRISRAPAFAGLGRWFNTELLTMEQLKDKVVLVDFWTYSCINCIRTLPYLKEYWSMYKDTGRFVLLGIHAPEFVFEKSPENVQAAINRYRLTYPVAQDNDFETWRAFENHYWPAKYLIDAEGYIRYKHFGEGDYDETDRAIRSLLAEAGVALPDASMPEERPGRRKALTSETYLGERSLQAYVEPSVEPLPLHHYALVGEWKLVDGERRTLRSDTGEVRMRFLGGEINLVLGGEGKVVVLIDGEEVKAFTIDHDDLYNLFTGDYGEHELVLKIEGKGVEAYAFTFGLGD